ncbi:MAG: FTR1 family iron permease [Pseudomonadota bacterium]
MGGQLGQIAFVIWRESVEALLVIGILNAWLARQADSALAIKGRRFLWLGVLAGLALAVLLGALLMGFSEALPDEAQDYFQAGMVVIAAALILQMIFWLRRHGRTLKRELEEGLEHARRDARHWSLLVLAMLAVAREGSETVVFLYGILAAGSAGSAPTVAAVIFGFAAALLTYWLLQYGGRRLSWRLFFRATEIMLLFLALSLVMTGVDHLVSLGLIPDATGPLWDSSFLLDDSGTVGGLVSALTGYRARPDLIALLVYGGYWLLVVWGLSRTTAGVQKPA